MTEFFDVIRQSGPHIYHSALPLAPLSSVVRNQYSQQICSSVSRIVTGVSKSWDPCTASAGDTAGVHHAVWSPCGQFIAAGSENTIQIRDSNTLERVSILNPPYSGFKPYPCFLTFSPNGCLLACFYVEHFMFVIFPVYL